MACKEYYILAITSTSGIPGGGGGAAWPPKIANLVRCIDAALPLRIPEYATITLSITITVTILITTCITNTDGFIAIIITTTVEPLYNEVLGTMKITLLYQVSHYIRVKKQRNIKSWDLQNYLVLRGFCYIRPRYNEVPLYFYFYYCNYILLTVRVWTIWPGPPWVAPQTPPGRGCPRPLGLAAWADRWRRGSGTTAWWRRWSEGARSYLQGEGLERFVKD